MFFIHCSESFVSVLSLNKIQCLKSIYEILKCVMCSVSAFTADGCIPNNI
uniref:Uncharacterized protein n=1 Tax=Anguilla anguilla TaxID=7936 RepID=A0A0E9UVE4_ANGAN